jgi:hypothetical protein
MIAAVFVTLAALTLSPTPPEARQTPLPRATVSEGAAASTPLAAPLLPADELYSLRARRRLASYLRLRLQELRLEHLDRAADAIERRIPIEDLVPVPVRVAVPVPKPATPAYAAPRPR